MRPARFLFVLHARPTGFNFRLNADLCHQQARIVCACRDTGGVSHTICALSGGMDGTRTRDLLRDMGSAIVPLQSLAKASAKFVTAVPRQRRDLH